MEQREADEYFFNLCIEELSEPEVSSDEGENKENTPPAIETKQPNTKPHQMTKIAEYVKGIPDGLNRKEILQHWDKLTVQLNEMGPPIHSRAEWRRVWSMHKFNTKRKHSVDTSVEISKKVRNEVDSSMNVPSEGIQSGDQITNVRECCPNYPTAGILDTMNRLIEKHDEHLDKMDRLLEKQTELVSLLTTVCELLKAGVDRR